MSPLPTGVYPASVTPFDSAGEIDLVSLARLLAWFESVGCVGAVLGGTNGEGPSLSAVERRDLLRAAIPMRGKLNLIQGIGTSSLEEAKWLASQSAKDGAVACLVMPPSYFQAQEKGIIDWFLGLMESSKIPILAYNFPKKSGVTITVAMIKAWRAHPMFAGVKDSSGEPGNLAAFRNATPDHSLLVGDETLLALALDAGWNGSISGAANVLARTLASIVAEWGSETARTRFEWVQPTLAKLRGFSQPIANKALLAQSGILSSDAVRLPLLQSNHDLTQVETDLPKGPAHSVPRPGSGSTRTL